MNSESNKIPEIEDFKTEVEEYKGKVLVDVSSAFCGPCAQLEAVMVASAKSVTDIKMLKLSLDKHPSMAAALNVSSIPTLLLYDSGTLLTRKVGSFKTPADFLKWLEDAKTAAAN